MPIDNRKLQIAAYTRKLGYKVYVGPDANRPEFNVPYNGRGEVFDREDITRAVRRIVGSAPILNVTIRKGTVPRQPKVRRSDNHSSRGVLSFAVGPNHASAVA